MYFRGAHNFPHHQAREILRIRPRSIILRIGRNIKGYNDGFVTTSPVGSFKPNKFGIYDLAGNAMEWCDDFYDDSHKQRVLRGGAWINCGPDSLWSSYRNHTAPDRFSVATGFRPVLVTDEKGEEKTK